MASRSRREPQSCPRFETFARILSELSTPDAKYPAKGDEDLLDIGISDIEANCHAVVDFGQVIFAIEEMPKGALDVRPCVDRTKEWPIGAARSVTRSKCAASSGLRRSRKAKSTARSA
jgi:hypothetical protein